MDWVVLTATAGFLAIGIIAGISTAATEPAEAVGNTLTGMAGD
ncbi:hypothetical protein ACXN5S_12780 [Pseudoroseicyclus sp. H15]